MTKFLYISSNPDLNMTGLDKDLAIASTLDQALRLLLRKRPSALILGDEPNHYAVSFDILKFINDHHFDIPFVFYGGEEPGQEELVYNRGKCDRLTWPEGIVFIQGKDYPATMIAALNKQLADKHFAAMCKRFMPDCRLKLEWTLAPDQTRNLFEIKSGR